MLSLINVGFNISRVCCCNRADEHASKKWGQAGKCSISSFSVLSSGLSCHPHLGAGSSLDNLIRKIPTGVPVSLCFSWFLMWTTKSSTYLIWYISYRHLVLYAVIIYVFVWDNVSLPWELGWQPTSPQHSFCVSPFQCWSYKFVWDCTWLLAGIWPPVRVLVSKCFWTHTEPSL